jgi:hypothetical protein
MIMLMDENKLNEEGLNKFKGKPFRVKPEGKRSRRSENGNKATS